MSEGLKKHDIHCTEVIYPGLGCDCGVIKTKMRKYNSDFIKLLRGKIPMPSWIVVGKFGKAYWFKKKPKIRQYYEGDMWTNEDNSTGEYICETECKNWKKSLRKLI